MSSRVIVSLSSLELTAEESEDALSLFGCCFCEACFVWAWYSESSLPLLLCASIMWIEVGAGVVVIAVSAT